MGNDGYSWLTVPGFALLIFNSWMAIYHSDEDLTIALVVISYLDLLALFYCFCLYDKDVSRDGRRRGSLRAAVWVLSTFLAFMFSYKVVVLFPQPISCVALAMATVLSLLLFFEFFVRTSQEPGTESAAPLRPKSSCEP